MLSRSDTMDSASRPGKHSELGLLEAEVVEVLLEAGSSWSASPSAQTAVAALTALAVPAFA